jgi:hypothetical protein
MEILPEQKLFLESYEQQLGILSVALSRSGVSREKYTGWLNNPDFKKKIDEINEVSVDFVENQLLRKIGEGDLQAIQFYLKTKGKKRGY